LKLADCHPSRKHKAKGMCGACYDRSLRLSNEEYRKNQRSNTSRWLTRLTATQRTRLNEIRRLRWERVRDDPSHKLKRRNARLLKKYSIGVEAYQVLLAKQSGGCAICRRKPTKIPLHVDHDHRTGKVRGLLCHQCNWYLGTIDADRGIVDRIINYLGGNCAHGIQRNKSQR
jgi:Recombination endonuclease VII